MGWDRVVDNRSDTVFMQMLLQGVALVSPNHVHMINGRTIFSHNRQNNIADPPQYLIQDNAARNQVAAWYTEILRGIVAFFIVVIFFH